MPELPEVETVARTLAPQVCWRRMNCHALGKRSAESPSGLHACSVTANTGQASFQGRDSYVPAFFA